MAKKHTPPTPGPWKVETGLERKGRRERWRCSVWANTMVADVTDQVRPWEAEANARLIAAAPELLAELQALVNAVDEYAEAAARDGEPVYLNVPESAYAAIKKARG